MREVDQRFGIIESGCSQLVDNRSASHKKHTFEQMIRQIVYQMAAGYEDCNEADYLRIDLVGEVFSKRTKGLDSSRFWSGMMVFWALPRQISTLKRENLTENWQMGMRNWFLGKCRIIQILINFHAIFS